MARTPAQIYACLCIHITQVETTSNGLFMNAGGLPLLDMQGAVVGAVGVAGAQDDGVAVEYAQKAWEERGL